MATASLGLNRSLPRTRFPPYSTTADTSCTGGGKTRVLLARETKFHAVVQSGSVEVLEQRPRSQRGRSQVDNAVQREDRRKRSILWIQEAKSLCHCTACIRKEAFIPTVLCSDSRSSIQWHHSASPPPLQLLTTFVKLCHPLPSQPSPPYCFG